jgi:hypothetical protein
MHEAKHRLANINCIALDEERSQRVGTHLSGEFVIPPIQFLACWVVNWNTRCHRGAMHNNVKVVGQRVRGPLG